MSGKVANTGLIRCSPTGEMVVLPTNLSISVIRKADLSKERDIVGQGLPDCKLVKNPVGIL